MRASGGHLQQEDRSLAYRPLTLRQVSQAKRLMRQGLDLHEAALSIGARSRDLDKALWANLGNIPEGW
jgi:hypothetical protein